MNTEHYAHLGAKKGAGAEELAAPHRRRSRPGRRLALRTGGDITVALPLRCRCITATSPLHHRCITTVTSPLHHLQTGGDELRGGGGGDHL